MNVNTLKQGQDVLYVQSGNEVVPGKLIRSTNQHGEAWNIFLFTDNGPKVVKEIEYNSALKPNTFHLPNEAEQSRAVGASSR